MLEQFARQSHIDGLTGLANRRSFDDAFETQTTIAGRSKAPLSVLMLDVDWFKKFNDAYGHPRGDDALRAVAQAIAASLPRRTDIAARYGGEEFVVILPGTATAGAHAVAERIRETVERLAISHSGSTYGRLSVSIGVATLVAEDRAGAPAALLARADAALYLAKAGGRNAVVPPLSLRREPIAGR
jgi:diguanylate cyclase (GGDEF)-like protein